MVHLFPEDYRWSSGVVNCLSVAPWGGAEIGEVDQVGRRLRKDVGNDALWFREWVRMANKVRGLGLEAEENNYRLSAAYHHKRAAMYFQIGERFRTPKDKRAKDAYRLALDSFLRFTKLTDAPRIERVEVPFDNGVDRRAISSTPRTRKRRSRRWSSTSTASTSRRRFNT